MALIKCEECGREISDKAMACIHCGCPISKNNSMNFNNNVQKEFVKKQSSNEFFDENTGRLTVEFDAVVSNKSKESTINSIYVKKLDKNVEILVPNNIKANEKIWKKIDNNSKCDLIIFTIKSKTIDSNVKSIVPEPKSKKLAPVNKTVYDYIKNYNPKGIARFFDGPAVGGILTSFITFAIIKKMWHVEILIAFLILAIPLIILKIILPFRFVKKYIIKNHIDDAIKNDPDYINIAFLTYKLMPGRRMLKYIKKININAGLEVERQIRKKK